MSNEKSTGQIPRNFLLIQLVLIIIGLIGFFFTVWIDVIYIQIEIVQLIFSIITYVGDTLVFIVIVAIIYIVYDKRFAKNLTLALLTTVYVNSFLKDIFQDPRPVQNDLRETGYGFPSGHSQGAATFWGYIGYEFKDALEHNLVPILFSIIILLVALSRIIIAVHDLQDISGGIIFGVCVLLVFIYLQPVLTENVNTLPLSIRIIIGVVTSLGLFILGTLLFPTSGEQLLGDKAIPFSDAGSYAVVGGVLLGLVGYELENEYVKYEPSKLEVKYKILNVIIGLIIVFVLYFGLEFLKDIFNSVIFRYIRYALISFILVFIVPWIFTKINPKTNKE
ncbi:MAG: PAP2 superfamily protein [Promethearchaeota archaeon]|nr:MAG: PAP2 superfamily protein [Candidatus Lokiarchaeota archaeon]